MKKCLQKKRNFPRQKKIKKMSCGENSGQNLNWRIWSRRKYRAPKFNAAKMLCSEISGGEISCCEIQNGENFKRRIFFRCNFRQRNLMRRKPHFLLKYLKNTVKMPCFKYLKNRIKFNKYRKIIGYYTIFCMILCSSRRNYLSV